MRVSFVIPARNEASFVGACLATIERLLPDVPHEVVVADHASTDATAEIARSAGATVVTQTGGTIGGLRNLGARASRGDVLVFLDADMELTPKWARRLPETLRALERDPRVLTGANCLAPADAGWIERCWFAPLVRTGNTHIGAANLVTTRSFFGEIGGFDETLETGEDYELSARAVRFGGIIVEDLELEAIHNGYPRSLRAFVKREKWHGRGDVVSLATMVRSRVVVAAAIFSLLHLLLVAALATANFAAAAIAAGAIVALCLAASFRTYGRSGWWRLLPNTFLYYCYFLGRSLSLAHARSRVSGFVERERREHGWKARQA